MQLRAWFPVAEDGPVCREGDERQRLVVNRQLPKSQVEQGAQDGRRSGAVGGQWGQRLLSTVNYPRHW